MKVGGLLVPGSSAKLLNREREYDCQPKDPNPLEGV